MALGFDVVSIDSPAYVEINKFGTTKDGQEKFKLPRALRNYEKKIVAEKNKIIVAIFTNPQNGALMTVELDGDEKASIRECSVVETGNEEEKDRDLVNVLIYRRLEWYGGLFESLPLNLEWCLEAMSAVIGEAQSDWLNNL